MPVAVRYAYDGEVAVRGGVTGRVYRFEPGVATEVAASDARVFVGSGQFVVEERVS